MKSFVKLFQTILWKKGIHYGIQNGIQYHQNVYSTKSILTLFVQKCFYGIEYHRTFFNKIVKSNFTHSNSNLMGHFHMPWYLTSARFSVWTTHWTAQN